MPKFLTDAQLAAEMQKCEFCEEKPCKQGCPAGCSPADFIMAAKMGKPIDFQRAASLILGNNPLGGVCGAVCSDQFCMRACVHKNFDRALNIPMIQATIIEKAKQLDIMPKFSKPAKNKKSVAILGAGPAGLAAAAVLARQGYKVTVFDKEKIAGGACNLIPAFRLDPKVLGSDIDFIKKLGDISFKLGKVVKDHESYLKKFAAVIVGTGLDQLISLGIPGEEYAVSWSNYLSAPKATVVKDKTVAVIGAGAVAVDCATTAKRMGAKVVDLIYRRNHADMPICEHERAMLLQDNVGIVSKTIINKIGKSKNRSLVLHAVRTSCPTSGRSTPVEVIPNSEHILTGYDVVISAVGNKSSSKKVERPGIFYAGEVLTGQSSVVESVASGKNAALCADAYVMGKNKITITDNAKNNLTLAGRVDLPISLECEFFGRKIKSPFLLSAAPATDGYEQMKKAYDAGWAGGVMKTAFDGIPIHIPAEYMFAFTQDTYANCDNVSAHHLDRVCSEIKRLVAEYPDRLTMGGTGGPVTGDDEHDKKGWQSNTKKLEAAGAMAVEYSLSCPQGGDGTEGDIVSQNAKLTAKIIDWVMEVSDPEVPKLFKLTGAVTSIYPILSAIKEVFKKYPNKKAGVTLANSFPTLAFREGNKKSWEEGIVVGMSGDGVKNISYLTLANAAKLGVTISGNGGPMDYKAAADFLALGAQTVQFCTIVMKYGVGIIDHLHSGLSYLMQERGIKSVKELIGRALPNPVTGFMDLSPVKKISSVTRELCEHCGNCARCPYLAITLDAEKIPVVDPAKCIGCSICTQKCFAGALAMRKRTRKELKVLCED